MLAIAIDATNCVGLALNVVGFHTLTVEKSPITCYCHTRTMQKILFDVSVAIFAPVCIIACHNNVELEFVASVLPPEHAMASGQSSKPKVGLVMADRVW